MTTSDGITTTSCDVHPAASLFISAFSNSELLVIAMNNDL
jgi:hypothetical protein